MRLVRAVLVKRETADGLVTVFASVPTGKEYMADLDTRRVGMMYNTEAEIAHTREIINILDSHGWRWMPTELLELKEELPDEKDFRASASEA